MKKTILLLLFFLSSGLYAQDKMSTTNAIISFEASVPYFEAVKAKNEAVSCYLNTKRSSLSFVVYVNMFRFERSLMEDHFNANYLETKKYPKATFKGTIEKFDFKTLTEVEKTYSIAGKIFIHGKSKNIKVAAKIKKGKNGIELDSNFTINTDDFNIEIPYIVRNKISKQVTIKLYSVLQ
ncbi:YceI family protein [Flavobacterium muglaense]|uniref:YceI family protein n=1 Tax=Flavobacterium muglaense TaxID=2764716 RepID=A0A923N2U2_9FLAO|nr:YceI family protein [Flavobacterium muglaense]MBC5839460.1 YceI family protein [Flavobacterium muglaense]MBC5845972.1 YceI family protein [Flavobacterium muglaense]